MSTAWAVKAFAPGTIGNVGCGLDVFGLAMERPGDEVLALETAEPGVVIRSVTGEGGRIPTDADSNSAGVAAREVLQYLGVDNGVALHLRKGLPLAGGMGGSAASAVAAAVAVDRVFAAGLPSDVLLRCALAGERRVGGSHADNVAPALYGGFVLVRGLDPPDVIELPVPDGLSVALVHPHQEVETRVARRMLGREIRLRNAITQWGNTAGVVAALFLEDWDLLSRCLVDVVAEPVRSSLVPGFYEMKQAALEAGALGSSLSGSGPTVFALCRDLATAHEVGLAMQEAHGRTTGAASDLHVSGVDRRGSYASYEPLGE